MGAAAAVLLIAAGAILPRGDVDGVRALSEVTVAGSAPARRMVHAAPPQVEPVELEPIAPDDAVAINAAIPFSTLPNPAARPFRFAGDAEAKARAVDCLASAMYYEAATEGDDGQRAVGQVVLNRVRHPAFPKSVCGVVFQGAERRTGCQFTFTCDGALARVPREAGWARARRLAEAALEGRVFRPVGQATHYHTNWVLPYWSGSLDKIVAVGTHLFFRWAGWWGTPPAFRRSVSGSEPVVPRLAFTSAAHRTGDVPDAALRLLADAVGTPVAATQQRPPLLADAGTADSSIAAPRIAADGPPSALIRPGEDSFIYLLDAAAPDAFPAVARRACGAKPFCKFQGWTDTAQLPAGYPVPSDRLATMSFSYLRDRDAGFDKMLWNCRQFPRSDPSQCMRG
ncbi:spore germination cell wall hydrolase CwlJ-like protein [Sphingomonas jejuensis]|uniref:Spore germination cell wall hydrolase CwlJ-like protein n=1 Tax=Sphingomonas jejuensis TaxID=904715 RepID=A0ABX0XLF8_9SPHN|nr:spore germination cell wall hydrolase CwlJ-like protein [Sphingomonas jejuensis]